MRQRCPSGSDEYHFYGEKHDGERYSVRFSPTMPAARPAVANRRKLQGGAHDLPRRRAITQLARAGTGCLFREQMVMTSASSRYNVVLPDRRRARRIEGKHDSGTHTASHDSRRQVEPFTSACAFVVSIADILDAQISGRTCGSRSAAGVVAFTPRHTRASAQRRAGR